MDNYKCTSIFPSLGPHFVVVLHLVRCVFMSLIQLLCSHKMTQHSLQKVHVYKKPPILGLYEGRVLGASHAINVTIDGLESH